MFPRELEACCIEQQLEPGVVPRDGEQVLLAATCTRRGTRGWQFVADIGCNFPCSPPETSVMENVKVACVELGGRGLCPPERTGPRTLRDCENCT